MNSIQIHRSGLAEPLLTVPLDDSFAFSAKQMGGQSVRLTVSAAAPLSLCSGDYVEWDGIPYSLAADPDYKHAEGAYTYDLTFQSPGHRLSYLLHKDEGSLTFPYDGNLSQQLGALYTSIGGEASGFTVQIEESIEKAAELRHIEFDKTYCLDALTRICEEFGTEWRIDGLRIRVGRWKAPAAGEFRYGRGKGLYSLEKLGVSNTSIVTRLYGFGSADNLPAGYRAQALVFTGEGGQSCLEKNTAKYGIREEAVAFEDIYPHLTDASLSAVTVPADVGKALSWTVALSLPADCTDIVVEKDKYDPRIKFTSGALMGEAFTITDYRSDTRQLDFNTSDDNGYKLPSATRQPAPGDQFVLLGITMPQSYVDLAEAELKARTQEELDRRCEKACAYRLDIDPRYVRREDIRVEVGGTVLVRESDDTEPVEIRVSELSYPLSDPGRLSLVLSDTPVYTDYSEKIGNDIKDVTHDVNNVHREARAFSRRAWRDAAELAEMLETLKADLLLVGNHTGQFVVSSTFTANKSNDKNLFHATGGQLRHAVYKGATDGIWNLGEANIDLPAETACYLYAQCSRTGTTAHYRISEAPVGVEEQDGWYHFPVGIVSSPFEGARVFNTTYGFTQIAGGTITTGKLQDPARRMVVDLDNGTITGPVKFTAGTSGLSQIEEWGSAAADIRDAQSTASAAKTVTDNFHNDTTEINGGLVLTSQIKMREGSTETGGLSADRDNILLWGGGTYAQAKTNASNILLRHDGSGLLAGGRILWDNIGNLKITNGAKIGEFDITGGGLEWETGGLVGDIAYPYSCIKINPTSSGPAMEIASTGITALSIRGRIFLDGIISGFAVSSGEITRNYAMQSYDNMIVCQNTAQITITLPIEATDGRIVYVRRNQAGGVYVQTDGTSFIRKGGDQFTSHGIGQVGWMHMYVYHRGYWLMNLITH